MNPEKNKQEFSFHEIFSNEESCDQTEILFQYFQKFLAKPEEAKFREHLENCEGCLQVLADLEESEIAATNTVLHSQQADRIFEQNRLKLRHQLDTKYGVRSTEMPFISKFRAPAFINAFLVLIVAVLIYPTYRSFVLNQEVARLQQELSSRPANPAPSASPNVNPTAVPEPLVFPTAVYPVRSERDGERKIIPIHFDEQHQTFALVLSLPPENFESYDLEIHKRGKNIWMNQVAPKNDPPQLISVNLPADYFEEGNYELTVSGKRGEGLTELSRYELRISKNKK